MQAKTITWILLVAAIAAPVALVAQPLKEKTQRKHEDEILQAGIKDANKACESRIKGTWDWKSFAGKLQDGGAHVGLNCRIAVDEIARMCRGDDTGEIKPAVQAGLTEFRCRGGGGKEGAVEMKGKTLVVSTSTEQEKRLSITEFLLEHL